ncbi:MAG: suppressor of fused domain protein [Hyphomonadaceae bacterium]
MMNATHEFADDMPDAGAALRDRLQQHLSRNIGDVRAAFIDADAWNGLSTEAGPPIDVMVVPPQGERRFAYLCTFGSALHPLGADIYRKEGLCRRVEFVLAVPQGGDAPSDAAELDLGAQLLRQYAKIAHMQPITIERGETVAFAKEPEPLFEGANQVAVSFMPPRIPSDGFTTLKLDGGDIIEFVSPTPICREELALARRRGPARLADELFARGVTEMLAPAREPVVKAPARAGWASRLLQWLRGT